MSQVTELVKTLSIRLAEQDKEIAELRAQLELYDLSDRLVEGQPEAKATVESLRRENAELKEQSNLHCACTHDEHGELTSECCEHEKIRKERDDWKGAGLSIANRLAASGCKSDGIVDAVKELCRQRDNLKGQVFRSQRENGELLAKLHDEQDRCPTCNAEMAEIPSGPFGEPASGCAFCILKSLNKELTDCLQWLRDLQNGCPLPKYETDWNREMARAARLLGLPSQVTTDATIDGRSATAGFAPLTG